MSLGRQIIAALLAGLAASISVLMMTVVIVAFEVFSASEGDPRLLAGVISSEIVAAITGWLPTAVIGLVFWRLFTWGAQKIGRPSRSLLSQLAVGILIFLSLLVLVEFVDMTQYDDYQPFSEIGVGSLIFLVVNGVSWGLVFWLFVRKKVDPVEDFA